MQDINNKARVIMLVNVLLGKTHITYRGTENNLQSSGLKLW